MKGTTKGWLIAGPERSDCFDRNECGNAWLAERTIDQLSLEKVRKKVKKESVLRERVCSKRVNGTDEVW